MRKINEERYLKKLDWCPPGRRRRRRRRKEGENSKFVDAGSNNRLREKGINNMECIDMEDWRRKIELKFFTRCDVRTLILCA